MSIFSTRQDLNTAISAWCSDSAAATTQYGDINTWNVSAITDMSSLFSNKTTFNSNISSWDVSNVTNMNSMFYYAQAFNQPLNSWNVSNVTNMAYTFYSANAFNQPINSWNVSQVTNMQNMFDNAFVFNQPINSWNVSNVVNMNGMFSATQQFNQPLNSWNVGNVTNFGAMFFVATGFNQPLSSWNVNSLANINWMFYDATAMLANQGVFATPSLSYFNQGSSGSGSGSSGSGPTGATGSSGSESSGSSGATGSGPTGATGGSGSVISNICFPAGTQIVTNQGKISIEKLQPNVHTIRNKPIVGITQTITLDKNLVCFEKDSLGPNIPSEKTIISKNHGIFYKGKMMKAKDFVGEFDNVYKVKYTGEVLYNVLMEEHDKMMVNNLICETLHPENNMAKIYMVLQKLSPKGQEELIRGCNEHIVKNNIYSSKKVTKKL